MSPHRSLYKLSYGFTPFCPVFFYSREKPWPVATLMEERETHSSVMPRPMVREIKVEDF